MEANECFIASVGKDWHKISNCNVHMNVKRRLQRTVIRGAEGDDLLDEGAESAEYTITGSMGMATVTTRPADSLTPSPTTRPNGKTSTATDLVTT